MRAIVGTRSDSTNVWQYVTVEPLTDEGTLSDARLPRSVVSETEGQYPHIAAAKQGVDRAAQLLRRLGWDVLDKEGNPYFEKVKTPA